MQTHADTHEYMYQRVCDVVVIPNQQQQAATFAAVKLIRAIQPKKSAAATTAMECISLAATIQRPA